jgi:hypothetical protein
LSIISNYNLELYTDSAGWVSKGCGAYCKSKWAYLQWPAEWESTDLLKDITFLEIIPIALSIFLWHRLFYKKNIVYCIDNMAVVSIHMEYKNYFMSNRRPYLVKFKFLS